MTAHAIATGRPVSRRALDAPRWAQVAAHRERVPGWIPLLGGRRVPPRAVVVAGALGALLLAMIWGFALRDPSFSSLGFASDGWRALMIACYAPLLLWAPLLALVTYDYHRRHADRR